MSSVVARLTAEEAAAYLKTASAVGSAAVDLLLTARAVRATNAQLVEVCQMMEDRAFDLHRELLRGRKETVPEENTWHEEYPDALEWLPILLLAFDRDNWERKAPWSEEEPAWHYLTDRAIVAAKSVLRWAKAHGVEWIDEREHLSAEAI